MFINKPPFGVGLAHEAMFGKIINYTLYIK